MLEVTKKANEMIKDHLKDQEELPSIRIFMNPGG
jgi:Fe-S cluster assembly iron-binding protein IscA